MLWGSKNLLNDCKPGSDLPKLAVSSTSKEWQETGRKLFQNKQFFQAKHAFERADMPRQAKIAETHYLRDVARGMPTTNKEKIKARRDAFRVAAIKFLECTEDPHIQVQKKEQIIFYRNAGDCFEQAAAYADDMEDYGHAARAYEKAEDYNKAIRLYRKCDMYDEAVEVLHNHREDVEDDLAENIMALARIHYFRRKDYAWVPSGRCLGAILTRLIGRLRRCSTTQRSSWSISRTMCFSTSVWLPS